MKSLKATLILRLLVGGMILLGGAGAIFQWRMRLALTGDLDSSLRLSAQSLQAFIEWKNHTVKMDSDVDDMPQFDRSRDAPVFLLRDAACREIKRSRSLEKQTLPATGGPSSAPAFFKADLADGRKLRCIGLLLTPKENDEESPAVSSRAGSVLLVVGMPRKPLEHTLEELGTTLLISGSLTLAGLAILLLWGVRRGLRPLDRLVSDISGITASSLDTRLPEAPLPTELRPIASRLNDLLARLSSVFEREKSFTANVSHELRTPLAELRALAEVNLMAPPESAADNAAGWIEVKTVSERMESLALRLLELARIEQPGWEPARAPVHLHTLTTTLWNRHATEARERGITCRLDIPEDLVWNSDPVLLDLILTNLISNAVHHADPGTLLHLAADSQAIQLTNTARDLTAADLPDLFERFWKKDASRTDSRRHGLGLALARETANLIGSTLEARLTGPDTIEFVLNHRLS